MQPRDPLKDEVAQLQREVACLQARLEQAETVIEIQKVALLLGEERPTSSNNDM